MTIYPVFLPQAGCRHRCLFCNQRVTAGTALVPEPATVADQLKALLPAQGDGEIAFYGGSFTLLPSERQQAYLAVAADLVAQGRAAGIRISTRPDALDDADVARLAANRVTTVEIGCQSFSPAVLRASRRGHGPEAAPAAVARLRRSGLAVGLHLMVGLPGGDEREAHASLDTALSLQPDFVRIHPTLVLRGTPLAALTAAGRYRPLSLSMAIDWCAALLVRCRQAGVTLARLGLQGNEGLERGDELVAGPYHPAFGQLVRSRLWRQALLTAASGSSELRVHPDDLADLLGHRRENAHLLADRYPGARVAVDATLPRAVVATPQVSLSIYAPTTPCVRTM